MQSKLDAWLQDSLRRVKRNIRIDDSDCDQPQVVLTPGPPILSDSDLQLAVPSPCPPLPSDIGLQQAVPSPCPPLPSDSGLLQAVPSPCPPILPLLSDSGLLQAVPSPCPPLHSDSDGSDDSDGLLSDSGLQQAVLDSSVALDNTPNTAPIIIGLHSLFPPLPSDSEGSDDTEGPISRRARRLAIQASLRPIDLLQHQQLRRFFGATRDGVAATALAPADPCNLWNSIPRRPSQYLDESAVHASDPSAGESDSSGSLSSGFISEHDDALPAALQPVEHQQVAHQQRGTNFYNDILYSEKLTNLILWDLSLQVLFLNMTTHCPMRYTEWNINSAAQKSIMI